MKVAVQALVKYSMMFMEIFKPLAKEAWVFHVSLTASLASICNRNRNRLILKSDPKDHDSRLHPT